MNFKKKHARFPHPKFIELIKSVYERPKEVAPVIPKAEPAIFRAKIITDIYTTSGLLEIGKSYKVYPSQGDDFSNVGWIDQWNPFVATGTIPAVWANGSFVYNTSDYPIQIIVFENTIGDIVITRTSAGTYTAVLANGFKSPEKCFVMIDNKMGFSAEINYVDQNTITLKGGVNNNKYDYHLNHICFEIRVYQ